jgi:hypothetical protein
MQENINNNQEDFFSEIIRQKLENHQLPVDVDSWTEIEKRLHPEKRKKVVPLWWITIGSAAVLALLFMLRPISELPSNTAKSEHHKIHQVEKTNTELAGVHTQKFAKKNNSTSVYNSKQQIKNYNLLDNKELDGIETTSDDSALKNITTKDSTYNNKAANVAISNKRILNEDIAQNTANSEDSIYNNLPTTNLRNTLDEEQINKPIEKSKNRNNWSLAAVLGSGGGVSPIANNQMLTDKGNTGLVSAATSYTSILTPNDFSNIVHYAPVSFGLEIRKKLNRVLGLESGLVYTYLMSTFENQGMQRSDAKLHLHYIGVPVNLVLQVWNNPKWDLYFSTGGMMEKGLQSFYKQNQYSGNQTYTTEVSSKIDGLQWSVNTSIGTTYKLNRKLGIYFEPKISYYLQNNQPMSARTVHPFVIGMNAGLRFGF